MYEGVDQNTFWPCRLVNYTYILLTCCKNLGVQSPRATTINFFLLKAYKNSLCPCDKKFPNEFLKWTYSIRKLHIICIFRRANWKRCEMFAIIDQFSEGFRMITIYLVINYTSYQCLYTCIVDLPIVLWYKHNITVFQFTILQLYK